MCSCIYSKCNNVLNNGSYRTELKIKVLEYKLHERKLMRDMDKKLFKEDMLYASLDKKD